MVDTDSVYITVAADKGGVGKTTTAVHLDAYLQTRAATVLIDGDPNRSATGRTRRDARRRGREHERPCDRVDSEVRPRSLNRLQLAQTVRPEVSAGEFIVRPGRVYAELAVEQRPH